jgi:hypothetical protein
VLIDASLVRMMLVPSVMSLLGKHAWWMPRWLEPIVPHLQLEGSAEPAPAPGPEPAEVVVEEVTPEPAAAEAVVTEAVVAEPVAERAPGRHRAPGPEDAVLENAEPPHAE